jgi:hypothetical protein
MTMWPNQITAHNAGWPSQFRYRGSRRESAVAQLFSLDGVRVRSMSTSKRKVIFGLVALALVLPLLAFAAACPVCGGSVVKTATVVDDTNAPSRNLRVWNRSICANLLYGSDSVICTRCWHAHSKVVGRWERAAESAGSFQIPLRAVIRDVPLPSADSLRSHVVFTQTFAKNTFADSVAFWCVNSQSIQSGLRAYCTTNRLHLSTETNRIAGQIYVRIE